MSRNIWHVTPHGDQWQVKKEGAERASSLHDTKAKAVAAAVTLAKANKPSQVKVHKKDGTFDYEYTYGDDPYPPKG